MKVICEKNCKSKGKDGTCSLQEISLLKDGGCGAYIKAPGYEALRADNVIVFDDVGLPSVMVRFSRMTNRELFGGEDKPHPMFVIQDKVYDELYISKYKNVIINGRAYSLPMKRPETNITYEEAREACRKKGEGWHLMTMMEHGFLANLCLKNGTLPHGNTNYGKYHADEREKGILAPGSGCITLAGSGPETWFHDHTRFGVDGLCGDIWEHLAGFRLMNGVLQAPKNNDAAADIDLSPESHEWQNLLLDGRPICVDAGCGIRFTNQGEDLDGEDGWDGCEWGDAQIDFLVPESMRELGLFAGDPKNYLYVDTEGERLPLAGGCWNYGAYAGVFSLALYNTRAYSLGTLGFRSAFYRCSES